MSDLSDYDKSRKAALAAAEAHELASIAEALSLLNALRLAIIARMTEANLSANDVYAMQRAQGMIDSALSAYLYQAERQLADAVRVGIENGLAVVERPAVAIGVVSPLPAIPTATMSAAEQFALDRVKGLTAEMRTQISGILRRVLGGAISPSQGIAEVGRSLSRGVFKNVAAKASAIVRTEVLTVQSQATHARMLQSSEAMKAAGYELRKAWLSAKDNRVRDAHAEAEDSYAVGGEPGPIPVDEPFIVDNEPLMFPRDWSGSPENVINCRCVIQPVVMRVAA